MANVKPSVFKMFVRDPLFHFLIAGGVIYGGYAMLSDRSDNAESNAKSITVTQSEIEWLSAQW